MKTLRTLLPQPSIRNKLVLLSFSFLLITVGLVFLLIYSQQRQLLQAQLAESMTAQARLLATNLHAAAAFVDRREADRLLASLAVNPAIEAARAELADGTPLSTYEKSPAIRHDIPEGEASQQFLDDHLLIRQPIVFPGQPLAGGRIALLISLEQYHQTMRQTMTNTGAFLLLALAILLMLTRLIVSHITAPLEYLTRLVQRVSHHARLDERLHIDSHDEIGSLSHGFNRMLDTLQARDQELASYRESLENMVGERTLALRQAIDEARQANMAKSDFLARMSHEIRTPLNAITGLSRMVLDSPLNPQQREYLDQVMHSSDALLAIINDILDYSKIEAGGLRLEQRPFAPERLLHSVRSLFAARARSQGLELRLRCAEGMPQTLLGDALRLGQVLINLVSNAIKFTPSGSIDVHLAAGEHLADGRLRLACSVRDSGIGIAAEHQENLFSPFTQADSSITRRFGGTGLGLAICRQLVELMGGEISLESTPGQGSTFRFTVVVAEPPAGSVAEKTGETRTDSMLPRWRGERILVVEDIAINRTIATALLERVGLHVVIASNGQEALDRLADESVALVLMDVQMPVMDGLSATRAIRANPAWRDLPVIAMTAHATTEDQDQTAAAGMNAHLTKPINPQLLYATLAQWLPPLAEQVIAAAPETDDCLPELPGIDQVAGLELHMNHPDFYRQSLHAFHQAFAGAGERVVAALAAGDRDAARRLAHSLRSVAAALGARELADAARELERELNDVGPTGTPPTRLARFVAALAQVIDGLAALPPLSSETLSVDAATWPEIDDAMDRLDDRLGQADARSEAEFAKTRDVLGRFARADDECRVLLKQIGGLIDELEYEPARASLRLLRHLLSGKIR